MDLYFPHKETECIISFPPSILMMSDSKLYRKYIATTNQCCEDDSLEEK